MINPTPTPEYVPAPTDHVEVTKSRKMKGAVRVWRDLTMTELRGANCTTCRRLVPVGQLGTHAAKPGGYRLQCQQCNVAACAADRKRNHAARLEADRRRNATPEHREYKREHARRDVASGTNAARRRHSRANYASRTDAEALADRARLRPKAVQRCRTCREWLPLAAFAANATQPAGVNDTCRACADRYGHARAAAVHMGDRNNFACSFCGGPAEHVDHIWPLALGGEDTPENMHWVCAAENLSKGSKPLFEWRPDLFELVKNWPCVVRPLPPRPGSPAAA